MHGVSYLRDPIEFVDRSFNKLDDLLDRPPARALQADGYPTAAEVRRTSLEWYGYEVADDFEAELLARLPGASFDGFDAVWSALRDDLDGVGVGLDADARLAATVWALVRHLRPRHVVETGVSRGILTRVILEALDGGQLWSIDLPPRVIGDQTRAAVPDRLRANWTFLRGSSRRHLPRLLRRLGTVDLFIHDSQHTERNMRFEIARGWDRVRPGGVLVSDDVHENGAFGLIPPDRRLIGQEATKAGLFGVAFKP